MMHTAVQAPAGLPAVSTSPSLKTLAAFVVMGLIALAMTFVSCGAVASAFAPVPLALLVLYVAHLAGVRASSAQKS